ncbi:MAG: T9SS type A sorting domain-containing protein [Bacteroidales bacterium]|nr:T9SS type A sorting domain-containing protein [Bacteroidales bacterium]
MKNLQILFIMFLSLWAEESIAQTGIIINSGAKLEINNAYLKINDGDFINNSSENTFLGTIVFNGSSGQTIGGTTNSKFDMLIINNGNTVNLENNLYLIGGVVFNNGILNVNNYDLTLAPPAILDGTFSSGSMINLDGAGKIIKEIESNDNILFPVGDLTSGADYSPVEITFNSGTFNANAFYTIDLANSKHPGNTSSSDYLNRYWTITSSGITNFSCNTTFNYTNNDIAGTESNIYGGIWNGTNWALLGQASALQFSGTLNEFGEITGAEEAMLGGINNLTSENIQVYYDNGFIKINTPNNINLSHVEIYNSVGQLITIKDLSKTQLNEFSFNNAKGYYLLKLFTDKTSITKKVLL